MKELEKILSSKATWYVAGAVLLVIILKRWNILPEGKKLSEVQAEKALEKVVTQIKNSGDIWNTYFWRDYPAKAFTETQINNLAKHIKNSFGLFNDDEARIEGVFRTLKYQTNVSQLAYAYANLYGRDLHSDLIDSLSKSEMKSVYEIISLKPL
jgi:hypothetical protein